MPQRTLAPKKKAAGGAAPARARARLHGRPGIGPSGHGPLYQQLVEILRDRIVKGMYPVGEQLPTENLMIEEFGVGRHTVREAMRQLRQDGLVASRRGAGSVVTRQGNGQGYVHRIDTLNELITHAGPVRFDVRSSGLSPTPAAVATRMGPSPPGRVLVLEGYNYPLARPDRPMCHTQVFVDAAFAGVERVRARRGGPIFELIEDLYGVRVGEIQQVLTARRVPSPDIARTLGVSLDAVVIEAARLYRLTDGKVAQLAISLYPAEEFQSTITLRRTHES